MRRKAATLASSALAFLFSGGFLPQGSCPGSADFVEKVRCSAKRCTLLEFISEKALRLE